VLLSALLNLPAVMSSLHAAAACNLFSLRLKQSTKRLQALVVSSDPLALPWHLAGWEGLFPSDSDGLASEAHAKCSKLVLRAISKYGSCTFGTAAACLTNEHVAFGNLLINFGGGLLA
jgi:hypothetical protein